MPVLLPIRVLSSATTVSGLLAFGIDIGAEVVLVWRLIRREASIAIEAIGTVLQGQSLHVVVELCHAFDDLLGNGVELRQGALILVFMFLKPRAVVVVENVVKECEDFFHWVRIFGKGKEKVVKKNPQDVFLRVKTMFCVVVFYQGYKTSEEPSL